MMKYKNKITTDPISVHDPLARLLRESCPEPHGSSDFTRRVTVRICRERRQVQAARRYWAQQTGSSASSRTSPSALNAPKSLSWRLLEALLSPLVVIVVLIIGGIVCRKDVYDLSSRFADYIVALFDFLSGISPLLVPVAGSLIMLSVLGLTFTVLGRR